MKDLSKFSVVELREELAKLETKRAGMPNHLALMATARTDAEMMEIQKNHQDSVADLRYMDLQIHDLKQEIASRETVRNDSVMTDLHGMTLDQLVQLRENLQRSHDSYEEVFQSGIDPCRQGAEDVREEYASRISAVEAEIGVRKNSKLAFYKKTLQRTVDALTEFKVSTSREMQGRISNDQLDRRLSYMNNLIHDLLSMKADFDGQK
jgi:ElaB/YqjD/DUF883 family membrane-anchored ribosome-binding protein